MMKALFYAASVLALSCAPHIAAAQSGKVDSVAEEPLRIAEARSLVDQLQLERALDSVFGNLKSLFAENVVGNMSRDAKGVEFFNTIPGGRDRFSKVLADEFLNGLRAKYPDFKESAAKVYAAQFTSAELQQLNAFFRSGVGAKWRNVSPEIEKSMGTWGEQAGRQVGMETMMKVMKQFEEEQKTGAKK